MQAQAEGEDHERPEGGRGKVLLLLSALNLAALVLLWAFEMQVGERHWLSTFLAYAPQHPVIVPTLGLLAWALVRRAWFPVGLNAAAGAFFAFALMGAALPIRTQVPASGDRVRVMTLNIHHASQGAEGIAALMREQQPDIACFQETNPHAMWSDPLPPLERLLPEWRVVRQGELAIFSRRPILSHRLHAMPGEHRRTILEGVVDIGGTRLTVLNVHFNTAARPRSLLRSPRSGLRYLRDSAGVRSAQMQALLEVAGSRPHPLLIAGDFNTPPRGRLYRRIAGRFRDSFHAAGWGFGHTFRSDIPVLRIDYLFLSDGLSPVRSFVPAERVSDHRPVVADIALPGANR